MSATENLAQLPLHADLRAFFTSFWGRSAQFRHSDSVVELVVAWNAEELSQITSDVASQLAAGEAVLIANTDSDLYFAVDNTSGAVLLCEPGCAPIQEVSRSLAGFLSELTLA